MAQLSQCSNPYLVVVGELLHGMAHALSILPYQLSTLDNFQAPVQLFHACVATTTLS
jgi:hypothetical protein